MFTEQKTKNCFGYLERMGDNTWSNKCGTFKTGGSLSTGGPRKH